MSNKLAFAIAVFATASMSLVVSSDTGSAQGGGIGTGPVGTLCADDIKAHCAALTHGAGAVRDCLEQNRSKVSDACRNALDTTGGGRAMRPQSR
jgi:hypothetical protein